MNLFYSIFYYLCVNSSLTLLLLHRTVCTLIVSLLLLCQSESLLWQINKGNCSLSYLI